MKNKEFDDFSFKAPDSQPSLGEISSKQEILPQIIEKHQAKSREINYRHLQKNLNISTIPFIRKIEYNINQKISLIDQQLEQNIKRRMELQKKLNLVAARQNRNQQRQMFMSYSHNTYKDDINAEKAYKKIEQKAINTDLMITQKEKKASKKQNKEKIIERNKQMLLQCQIVPSIEKEHILIPTIQQYSSFRKQKPLKVYTLPDQIKIQSLLRKISFPELPQNNLSVLQKQIQTLFAVHSPHSDIHYLLMIVYFHQQKYIKVRQHYKQILNFKIYNAKCHWIAAQSEFFLQNYDLCLKLTEQCMNKLEQRYLPRFIYLKAKCYEHIGNYINSVVCFNQLIKLKPKIGQYYLQRGIIYHRIGYFKQAKQDFVTFGLIKPQAQRYIKDKILSQANQIRKKQLIAIIARIF